MAGKKEYLEHQLEYQNSKVAYLMERGSSIEKMQYHLDKIDYIKGRLQRFVDVEKYIEERYEPLPGE